MKSTGLPIKDLCAGLSMTLFLGGLVTVISMFG